jgi:FemAB family
MAITVLYKKFSLIPITVKWFNTEPAFEYDAKSLFYILRQSSPLDDIKHYPCVKEYKSTTSIIDLTLSEEQLWEILDPKSCRYEIRKVLKMLDGGENVEIRNDSDLKQFLNLANNYIRKKGYSKPLTLNHFQRYIEHNCGELITLYHNGRLIGGNFYIMDHPSRVRLLYSFNDRFEAEQLQKLSGPLMRYLHWHAMVKKYKKNGFLKYDMGGVDLRPDAETHGISKFKLSFGGKVVEEYNYVFTRNRVIAIAYNAFCKFIKR